MKKIIITLLVVVIAMTAFAQTQTNPISIVSPDSAVVYRLYSTRNTWNFIKLNTRNGQMWQVQWNTGSNRFETPISLTTRVSIEEEMNGRFFLYPTHNIYNFILLDQIDGRMWQVQWGMEDEDRMVIRIY
ncbi:MAG: hypothetical protein LBG45_02250 [Dysgonamonadaceae bacterium]|jgi:hypothetical protein|nr:hypothetical protein [Dysgonamonadaceae bacterium]